MNRPVHDTSRLEFSNFAQHKPARPTPAPTSKTVKSTFNTVELSQAARIGWDSFEINNGKYNSDQFEERYWHNAVDAGQRNIPL